MSSIPLRRPSPALVVAVIALFAALGGTGYAATTIVAPAHAAAKKKSKTLTKSQVNKLVAAYVKAHKTTLRGATGPAGKKGANGTNGTNGTNGINGNKGDKGDKGDQGPGAIRVAAQASSSSNGAQPLATVGPWTLTDTCSANGTNGIIKVTGPGSVSYTESVGTTGGTATTILDSGTISSGKSFNVIDGKSLAVDGFLQSGSTLYELKFQMSANNPGLFEDCPITGEAIPIP